eukprot:TRINITY_DN3145_c2_g5_i1.p1 TRINITY_DN3145_c2_g5~~TRINITY_DN3145_c2_g5_i1.p1  ORF type:complete len:255 (+),score=99.15 TRINITY_DN3145_c2_g5_i1:61-825(+)
MTMDLSNFADVPIDKEGRELVRQYFDGVLPQNNIGAVHSWMEKTLANHKLNIALPLTPVFQDVVKQKVASTGKAMNDSKGGKKGGAIQGKGGKGGAKGGKGDETRRFIEKQHMDQLSWEREKYGGYTKAEWEAWEMREREAAKERERESQRERERERARLLAEQERMAQQQMQMQMQQQQQQQQQQQRPRPSCPNCDYGEKYYFCPKTGKVHPTLGEKSSIKLPIIPTADGVVIELLSTTNNYALKDLKSIFGK